MLKASLIAQILTGRQNLEITLSKLDPEQLEITGAVGFWSIKDTLAHLASWQQRLTTWLSAYAAGIVPQVSPPYGLEDEPLHHLNHQIYLENRAKTLPEVLRFFRFSYQQTLEMMETTTEELLNQIVRDPGQAGLQVWEIVAANTFEHDQEHHHAIQVWLEATPQ